MGVQQELADLTAKGLQLIQSRKSLCQQANNNKQKYKKVITFW